MERDDRNGSNAKADTELVAQVQRGNRSAFRALYDRYSQRVYGIAYGVVRNSEDAMDITQQAFIKVHRHLDQFQGSSSFYTWLYRIVLNLSIDHVRKGRGAAVDFDDALDHQSASMMSGGNFASMPIRDPASEIGRKELLEHLDKALDGLSAKHRQVILLREIEGLSYKEIADVLDISVGTVMSRLHHARQNLQVSLRRYLDKDRP